MICANCTAMGEKLKGCLTFKERVQMLTSTATMMRHLDANINAAPEDKQVASSIATKLLLSFEDGPRAQFLQMLRQSAGVDIVLKNCAHGVLSVV